MNTIKTVVIATGGFDPIHSGHINYLNSARESGDYLIVGLNSDRWLERKKGSAFMPWAERAAIVANLAMVNDVIAFDDNDNSAIDAINQVKQRFDNHEIIFANGGDRTPENIPEMIMPGIVFKFNVGGSKTASSSDFLQKWLDTRCQ